MKVAKHDRRSERTQSLLIAALIDLLTEHRYADLTVQNILDRANIGRSTFYAHFWDKDDLLASSVERMVTALSHQMDQTPGEMLPSLGLFQHVREQYPLYQALVRGEGIALVLRTLRTRLSAQVEQKLRARATASIPDIALTVMAEGSVGALLALVQWWMEAEPRPSPQAMDAYFRQLIRPGLQVMLASASDPTTAGAQFEERC